MKAIQRFTLNHVLFFLSFYFVVSTGAQNVGIGILNPTAKLQVESDNVNTVQIRNIGTGSAGIFETNNPANTFSAMFVKSNGSFYGFDLQYTGTATAAHMAVLNQLNNKSALYVTTDGTGGAGQFYVSNPNNQNAALSGTSFGAGPAGAFDISNNLSPATSLQVTSQGTGKGVHILLTNLINSNTALFCKTSGTGSAGYFEIANSANINAAFSAGTSGTGSAALVGINNSSSNATAMSVTTTGLGKAGLFTVNNASNNLPALQGITNGSGYGGYFGNTSNAASVTHYGMAAYASGGGTSSRNVGGYFSATGATQNYAAVFAEGDVGIGTTGPNEKLEIASNTGRFITSDGSGVNRRCILFVAPVTGTDYGRIEAFGYGTSGGGKVLALNNLGGGKVGIGTSAPDQQLSVDGGASKVGGGSWSTFSDVRMKKNISQFDDGLNVINQLNPVGFEYNGSGGYKDDGKHYVGVIAQEIQKIAPYMVEVKDKKLYETDNSTTPLLMYDPSDLIYILVNAVKEQQKMIRALEEKNVSLNNGNSEMAEKVSNLSSQLNTLTVSLENIKQQFSVKQ